MGIGLIELTAPTVEPVTLAEVKLHSRIGINDDDALLAVYITSARQLAEQKTGRSLAPRTLVRYYDEFPDSIELLKGPITSIDFLKYINEAGVLTIPSGTQIVRLLPALNLSRTQAEEGLQLIEKVVRSVA